MTGAPFDEPMRVEIVRMTGPGARIAGPAGIRSERFSRVTPTLRELEGLDVTEPGLAGVFGAHWRCCMLWLTTCGAVYRLAAAIG